MPKVADIMIRNVETVGPDATIQEAAERMKSENVGSLPVCLDSRLLGALTDRDITVRVTAEGRTRAPPRCGTRLPIRWWSSVRSRSSPMPSSSGTITR